MKAIILPLNKFYLNFEKYDGSGLGDSFDEKHPHIINFSKTKTGEWILKWCMAFPCAVLVFLFYVAPLFIYCLLRYGVVNALPELRRRGKVWVDKIDAVFSERRKNVADFIEPYHQQGFSFFIYFNASMVPTSKKKRIIFLERLELMKNKLNVFDVFEANSKEDIEKVISAFNINPQESFFMTDGKIDLDDYRQLGDEGLSKATFAF